MFSSYRLLAKKYKYLVAAGFVVCLLLLNATPVTGTVQWSDNFNDGELDAWTQVTGEWTAEGNALEVVSGIPAGCEGEVITALISHESPVVKGTWSFDLEYDLNTCEEDATPEVFFMTPNASTLSGYSIEIQPILGTGVSRPTFRLMAAIPLEHSTGTQQVVLGSYDGPEGAVGQVHFDITRKSDGGITVSINGTSVIEAVDTRIDTDVCENFVIFLVTGWTIDNIVVDDSIAIGQGPLLVGIVSAFVIALLVIWVIKKK